MSEPRMWNGDRDDAEFDAAIAEGDREDARQAAESKMERDATEGAPVGRQDLGTLARAAEFILAGNAIFTLQNAETGARFTYKVTLAKRGSHDRPRPWFVSVLTGSNNEEDYTYLGCIWKVEGMNSGLPSYARTSKSPVSEGAPSQKGAAWLVKRIAEHLAAPVVFQNLKAPMSIFHEGRCGRCGRLLTVPESIENGLGPICAEKEE